MRNFFLKASTLLTFLVLFVIACQRELLKDQTNKENDDDSSSLSVSEAKIWFETNQQPIMVFKSGQINERKSVNMKPDWNRATKSKKVSSKSWKPKYFPRVALVLLLRKG